MFISEIKEKTLFLLVTYNHFQYQKWPSNTSTWISFRVSPKSEEKEVILVMVDRLTKYNHFTGLSHHFTTYHMARAFMDQVYKLYGLPKFIIFGRGSIFLSNLWQELFNLLGTDLKFSFVYHPQTDGQTKRVNACLETYLRCMSGHKRKAWHL